MDFAASTTAALDSVLTREGFSAGQGGGSQLTYCASYDDLSDRCPRLPQAGDQPRGRGCCIDLTLYAHNPGLTVHLEGWPLAATLRQLQLDELARSVDGLEEIPLAPALEILVDVLPRLFAASRP